MRQSEGYEPIGEYQSGIIRIPLEDHELTVNAVRFGPKSQYLMGPFTVYGSLDQPEVTPAAARENAKKRVVRKLGEDAAKQLLSLIESMPFAPLNRITSGLMVVPTAQLEAMIGPWGNDIEHCGR